MPFSVGNYAKAETTSKRKILQPPNKLGFALLTETWDGCPPLLFAFTSYTSGSPLPPPPPHLEYLIIIFKPKHMLLQLKRKQSCNLKKVPEQKREAQQYAWCVSFFSSLKQCDGLLA